MRAIPTSNDKKPAPAALNALRRAAKKAIDLGRLTGTPAYVLRNGQIVDAAKHIRKTRKVRGRA